MEFARALASSSCEWGLARGLFGTAALTALIVTVSNIPTPAAGQLSGNPLTDAPTQERLQQPGWWPTKPLSLERRGQLVGNQKCASCHPGIVRTQRDTEMARTLTRAGTSSVEQHLNDEIFNLGRFRYSIQTSQGASRVTANEGTQSVTAPIEWVFGSGTVGQSYYWDHEGSGNESRFSYFNRTHGFDYTPGLSSPDSLAISLGKTLSNAEARTCFACHSTVLTEGKPEQHHDVIEGIGCETCHGPGAKHVIGFDSGDPRFRTLIQSMRTLSPGESVNFCGACHRTSADVELMGVSGIATVRFPAFRLQESRCWGKGDVRLTCVACHDPHKPLEREAAFYDQKCLACHQNSPKVRGDTDHAGKSCPVASRQCVSCHMPKYEIQDMHSKFTDHRIRVNRVAEAFPQ